MDLLNQNTPPGFDAIVGAKVPNTIVIAPVTAQAGSDVPALKPYSFAMVQKKLVIVNPSNRKIANMIAQERQGRTPRPYAVPTPIRERYRFR